jgi:lysophospholipid acyltransferase (LPLAT)-like uncharacterized protein
VSEWKYAAVSLLSSAALSSLFATVNFEVEDEHHLKALQRSGKPFIFALWHGRLLPLSFRHRNQDIVTLISRSADGEYLARILERWGFLPARGSSSRGGMEGLRQLVREARHGHSLAVTPDGPRGPMQQLKPGVLVAAQLSGLPILPLTASSPRAWWPGKWDRFLVPKPFSTVHVRYAAPVRVARYAGEADLERLRGELEGTLNTMTAELDRRVGLTAVVPAAVS